MARRFASPPRTARIAPIAVALALASGAVAIASACSDEETPAPATPDGGAEDGEIARATCPVTTPAPGAECLLPEGTTCGFGDCGARFARCSQAVWVFGTNPPSRPVCPELPPDPEVACSVCWPADVVCSYGSTDCTLADASVNTAVASCIQEQWILDIRPCRAPDDGGGPDVQGDGEADAD